jgi:alpha-L-fucosidase 2
LGVPSSQGEENGFVVHTASNIFGFTAPYQVQEFGWNVGGMSYILTNVWDYYTFSGDKELLSEIYPMFREMATFYEKLLWWSPYQKRLVVAPSHSPEQGPVTNGTTYDQMIAWEAFEQAIKGAEILAVDADRVAGWKTMQSQLNPIQIGEQGQIKEWFEESRIGFAKAGDLDEVRIWNYNAGFGLGVFDHRMPHRHISHLVGLYPGTLINKDDTPEAMEAARVSLEYSGLVSTGWGRGHRLPARARLGDGEMAYDQVKAHLAGGFGGMLHNLWNSHGEGSSGRGTAGLVNPYNTHSPEFQIDGNFGFTAGIQEMLVQSHLGYTQFLPAIPKAWSKGRVDGLVARGNFVIGMDWSDGTANYFNVTSRIGSKFIGEYRNISGSKVVDSSGRSVPFEIISADRIAFDTVVGETYTITPVAITSIKINAIAIETVKRGQIRQFSVTVNEGASSAYVEWKTANPALATVDKNGVVTVKNVIGTVVLTATDPDTGSSHSILLRIAS